MSLRQGKLAWSLAILTFVLAVADVVGTEILIRYFGGEEANPIWAWLMSVIGVWWIVPKLLLNSACSLFFLACWRIPLAKVAVSIYIATYAAVVACHIWLMTYGG